MKHENISAPHPNYSLYQKLIQGFSLCVAVSTIIIVISYIWEVVLRILPEFLEVSDGVSAFTTSDVVKRIMPFAAIVIAIELVVLFIVWRSYLLRVWGCVATCGLSWVTMVIFMLMLPHCDSLWKALLIVLYCMVPLGGTAAIYKDWANLKESF